MKSTYTTKSSWFPADQTLLLELWVSNTRPVLGTTPLIRLSACHNESMKRIHCIVSSRRAEMFCTWLKACSKPWGRGIEITYLIWIWIGFGPQSFLWRNPQSKIPYGAWLELSSIWLKPWRGGLYAIGYSRNPMTMSNPLCDEQLLIPISSDAALVGLPRKTPWLAKQKEQF